MVVIFDMMTNQFQSQLFLFCVICICPLSTNSLERPRALEVRSKQGLTQISLANLTKQPWRPISTSYPAYDYDMPADVKIVDDMNVNITPYLILCLVIQVYMIFAEVLVCKEYLLPSVLVISDNFKISKDVVGGTFLAFAVSTPLLLDYLMKLPDAMSLNPDPNFNSTFSLVLCCFFKKRLTNVLVSWWTVTRSVVFYSIVVMVTFLLTLGGTLDWYHPMTMILFYFGYCFLMANNDRLRGALSEVAEPDNGVAGEETSLNAREPSTSETTDREDIPPLKYTPENSPGHSSLGLDPKNESPPPKYSSQMFYPPQTSSMPDNSPPKYSSQMIEPVGIHDDYPPYTEYQDYHLMNSYVANLSNVGTQTITLSATTAGQNDQNARITVVPDDATPKDPPLSMKWPTTFPRKVEFVIKAPAVFLVWLTLPDVRRSEKRKWYALSYLGSIVWLLVFHFFLTQTIEIQGLWPPTGIALFTSCVLVVRSGFGDMAISTIYGSSIFDLTIGLPLPCMIATLANGQVLSLLHLAEALNPVIIQICIVSYLCCSLGRLTLGLGFLAFFLPFVSAFFLLLLYPGLKEYLIHGRHYA